MTMRWKGDDNLSRGFEHDDAITMRTSMTTVMMVMPKTTITAPTATTNYTLMTTKTASRTTQQLQ